MPDSLCQLAVDWRGDMPADGLMAEEKRDGWRGLRCAGIDGVPRLFTRRGQLIEGAGHILYRLALMERAAGQAMVFDGEFQVDGSLAATKAWCEGGWRRGGEAGVFHLFDCLSLDEWNAGGTDLPLYARKARLQDLARAVDDDEALSWEWRPGSRGDDAWRTSCPILPDLWVSDVGDVLGEARRVWATKGEGLMLKDAEAPYRRNRNAAWQKVKQTNAHHWRKAA
ncbi:ATP-dependent DNA ligase [Novosphingobium sp.]|uniref:ATP-dependent DNA ligase n=1 Tax=Novosphingobium sp. TaxID=1874826 RepID=UPI002FDDF265